MFMHETSVHTPLLSCTYMCPCTPVNLNSNYLQSMCTEINKKNGFNMLTHHKKRNEKCKIYFSNEISDIHESI